MDATNKECILYLSCTKRVRALGRVKINTADFHSSFNHNIDLILLFGTENNPQSCKLEVGIYQLS